MYLNNPAAWHSKYVLGINDQKTNPSALTGVAFHRYVEHLYKGEIPSVALEVALAYMRSTTEVEWGKTGSLEKCMQNLNALVDIFQLAPPKTGTILGVEIGYEQKIPSIKTPIKGFCDLVYRDETGIVVRDWKTTSSFPDAMTPAQIFQGVFYAWLIKAATKEMPSRFEVVMLKASKNSDGSPQIKTFNLIYKDHPEYFKAVKGLTNAALKEMTRKRKIQLINLRDDWEGQAEWDRLISSYAQ